MLQDLVSMKCLDNWAVEPGGLGWQRRRLLCEFTKGVLVLLRSTAVGSHRLIKGWIVRGEEEALLGGDNEYLVAYIEMQTVSQIAPSGVMFIH